MWVNINFYVLKLYDALFLGAVRRVDFTGSTPTGYKYAA